MGQSCDQRPCVKRGYCFVPRAYLPVGHGEIDPDIGKVIGGHLLVAVLGGGGFGKVYIALQLPLLMRTALKLVLPEAVAGIDDALPRFEAEARALARLSHPNVVRLLQYGTHAGKPFMVMELVEGGMTLKAELARRAAHGEELSGEMIRDILEQLLNGLEAAHALGIIHRDVKPENLMLQRVPGHERLLKILDFGLVKELADGTRTSAALGTPAYMAPEQILKKNLGPWTDLYAVGAVAFELMTGRRAFSGPTPQAIVARKLDAAADPLAHAADLAIPPVTAAFLRRAMAMDPAARYRSVGEMRDGLRAACAEIFAAVRSVDISQLVSPSEVERARVARVALLGDAPSGETTMPPEPAVSKLATPGTSRRWPWMLVAGVAIGAVALFVALRPSTEQPPATAPRVAPPIEAPRAMPPTTPPTGPVEPDTVEVVADTQPDNEAGPSDTLAPAAPSPWRTIAAAPNGVHIGVPADRRVVRATSLRETARIAAPTHGYRILARVVTRAELARQRLLPAETASTTPATHVAFAAAERFCEAVGGRLPTEAEWEWAARSLGDELGIDDHPEWTDTLWRDPETGETPSWVTDGDQTFRTLRLRTAAEGIFGRDRFCATGPCVARTEAERPPITFRCVTGL